jgi:chromosome segregation ATPase
MINIGVKMTNPELIKTMKEIKQLQYSLYDKSVYHDLFKWYPLSEHEKEIKELTYFELDNPKILELEKEKQAMLTAYDIARKDLQEEHAIVNKLQEENEELKQGIQHFSDSLHDQEEIDKELKDKIKQLEAELKDKKTIVNNLG